MRDAGASKAQAASVAKNVTVNFNRKGELGGAINSLYAFFNAGVQGTARLAQALNTKRGRNIAAGAVAASFALDQWNRANAGDSDNDGLNDYDAIPDYVKERNLVLMRGEGKKPLMIPLPYGYNILHVFGQQTGAVFSGAQESTKAAKNVFGAAMGAFNPLGGESDLVQQASPTFFDPAVQLVMNRNFAASADQA